MTDLVSVFCRASERFGDRVALVDRTGSVSFTELIARAAGFAQRCRARGLGKGDRLLVAMPVGADLFAALAGAWMIGAVVVFPEPAMGLAGLRHAIRTTRPRGFVATGPYRWLRCLPGLWFCPVLSPRSGDRGTVPNLALAAGDGALISFTSGSTGAPKAILRSHGFLMAQHDAVAPLLDSASEEIDLVAFPVFTLINLAAGRTAVLPDWRLSRPGAVSAEHLAGWIEKTGCTRALLPPSLCETLSATARPGALHTIFTGGGPVKPRLVTALQDRGLRVVSVYGSTEAEPIAELDWADVSTDDLAAMAGGAGLLAGPPVPGLSLRIVAEEIQVAGAHVNESYLDPAQNADTKQVDGDRVWHRTGDAGRLDDRGRLWLLGRHGAIAQGPAGPLHPFAVELAAESWPGVRRAALTADADGPVLAIEGAGDMALWQSRARDLGLARIRLVPDIPLDRRHRSKVDYGALAARMRRGG